MIERSRAAAARILLRLGLSQFATGLALKPRSFAGDHAANLRHQAGCRGSVPGDVDIYCA